MKIFFSMLLCLTLICGLALSASAAVYDISDFFSYAEVDTTTNNKTAYFEIDTVPVNRFYADDVLFAEGSGTMDVVFPSRETSYDTATVNSYPFGKVLYTGSGATDGIVDVSDIMNGAVVTIDVGFDIMFDTLSQAPMEAEFRYRSVILAYDSNYKLIDRTVPAFISTSLPIEGFVTCRNSVSYTLPSDTVYIGIIFQSSWDVGFSLGTFQLQITPHPVQISVESNMIYEQSQTMHKIEQQLGNIGGQLGQTNDKLDNIITGDSGVDVSDTDFGYASDQFGDSMGQVNSAISGGNQVISDMANSSVMTGTVSALAGGLGAFFQGNEITICGITANPFTLAFSVIGTMALIVLVINYVFRKRGGG